MEFSKTSEEAHWELSHLENRVKKGELTKDRMAETEKVISEKGLSTVCTEYADIYRDKDSGEMLYSVIHFIFQNEERNNFYVNMHKEGRIIRTI